MNQNISPDSLAILLLCSNIGLNSLKGKETNYKSFSDKEWIKLSQRIVKSEVKRPSALFNLSQIEIQDYLQLPINTAERIKYLLGRTGSLTLELEKLSSMGIWVITRADPAYPKRLKKILKLDSPTILYGAGKIDLLNDQGIGIVGSRDVDDQGAVFTDRLARRCAKEKFTVISGGSRGVDLTAQNAALEEGGKVVAVLSDSLAKTVQKKEILEHILKGNLLLISAYHPNSRFYSYSALGRNKHIYGLSKYTVVSSSSAGKGGTWKGAIENLEAKWVPLFVRDEEGVPNGNIELISKGGIGIGTKDLKEAERLETLLQTRVSKHINSEENNASYEKRTNIKKTIDLFNVVWPYIERVLNKPRSIKELCMELNIEESQMDVWVKKAYSKEKIKYVDETKIISTVFFNKQEHQNRQINIFELPTD
ncbi:DNA-processing protein DprA [Bacillus cabrialesii]|uniref:DNA-processing protein DprA n=1 Tax=Bacillus cabrialesii TaxID=2487276 RepID=UPI0013761FE0|nr:DNA-processing protein DprA [Bacillus cabrialesii]UQE80248.1 DNA-processing protein DprA [Bacillus cabrialesii]